MDKLPMITAVRVAIEVRRRVATALAVLLALVCSWHAFFGQNGITAYAQKRTEDRELKVQIDKLAEENARLQDHVEHLQTDPDAIEMEARQRLHYTRAGEVIYTLSDKATKPDSVNNAMRVSGTKTDAAEKPRPR